MNATPERQPKLFWHQEAADAGDNPYFPEFTGPDDQRHWREMTQSGGYFTYVIYTDRVHTPISVGYTGDVHRRLRQHRKAKAWWPLVDKIIVGRCDTSDEAREGESRFIETMKPLFNIAGNRHA